MVANAMWYGTTPPTATQDVHLGPFTFSPQELTTSLMMSLIVVPINMLIVTLFRKASPKLQKPIVVKSNKTDAKEGDISLENLPRTLTPSGIFTVEKGHEVKCGSVNRKRPLTERMFPHWVVYIAWFLVLVSVALPGFFTILYSMEWGADKSSRWLSSFVLSFVESVILIQPVKVLMLALVLALIFKKVDYGEEAPAQTQEGETITYGEEPEHNIKSYASPMLPAHRRPYMDKPPDFSTLNKVRTYRKQQNRLWAIIKDIGSYVIYLVIISVICYENRDENSFRMVDNVRNLMVKDFHTRGHPLVKGFAGVTTFDSFWEWTTERLVPSLYLQSTFNGGSVPSEHMSLLNDFVHFRVGPPRIRQARVLKDSCTTPIQLRQIMHSCIGDYGWTNYDQSDYDVKWGALVNSSSSTTSWHYQGVMDLSGIPTIGNFESYSGGGYVAVLGNDNTTALDILQDLKDNRWLDRQTRAVFIETNLYNPFVNMFCAVTLMLEFLPSGSAISFAHIVPLRLYRYVGPSALFMVITDLIFVAFTIYFLVRLINDMKACGRKWLYSFWNFIELLNVTSAVLCCAFYGVHFIITSFTLSDFREHPGEFVNFQRIVLWDEVFGFIQGFLLFFSMLKLLRLIRFNTKIVQLSTTLRKAVGPILNFFVVFTIVFLAFTQFAYLVFGPTSSEYFSFLTSLETLFSMLLMKVNIDEIMMANGILAPLFLFTFVLTVVFVLLNMLLTILNETFTTVRLDKHCRSDDPEMVDFMFNELKRIVGMSAVEPVSAKKKKIAVDPKAKNTMPSKNICRWLTNEGEDQLDVAENDFNISLPPITAKFEKMITSQGGSFGSKDWLKALHLSSNKK